MMIDICPSVHEHEGRLLEGRVGILIGLDRESRHNEVLDPRQRVTSHTCVNLRVQRVSPSAKGPTARPKSTNLSMPVLGKRSNIVLLKKNEAQVICAERKG